MASCGTKTLRHPEEDSYPSWWSEYQYCIESIEQTGDKEVTMSISIEEVDMGDGYYPCMEIDISVGGTIVKTYDLGCGLDVLNYSPHKVKITGLEYGEHDVCISNLRQYQS